MGNGSYYSKMQGLCKLACSCSCSLLCCSWSACSQSPNCCGKASKTQSGRSPQEAPLQVSLWWGHSWLLHVPPWQLCTQPPLTNWLQGIWKTYKNKGQTCKEWQRWVCHCYFMFFSSTVWLIDGCRIQRESNTHHHEDGCYDPCLLHSLSPPIVSLTCFFISFLVHQD